MNKHYYLAFDIGASSGRAILGTLENKKLTLTEIYRFKNEMTRIHGRCYWNIFRLFDELKMGLRKCIDEFHVRPESIGIDTWGVDYALVTGDGRLAGLPYAYRDHRTDHALEDFFTRLSRKETYLITGIQFLQFNTLYQLFVSANENDPILKVADGLLFIPDALGYLFTGVRKNEYTIASTSQMLKPGQPVWEHRMFEAAGIPERLAGEIILPGTVLGSVLPEIDEQTGCGEIPCIAVASHDTASAVVSVPADGKDWAYLSSGTWSLLGIETGCPLVSEKSLSMNFTNEGGAEQTTRYLKNIMGMWLMQECKRIWDREKELSWKEIVDMSISVKPFRSLIDPDASCFLNPVSMPEAIMDFCRSTRQPVPETQGEIARCIYDSLVLKYRHSVRQIEEVTAKPIGKLHVIGGGAHNTMLNQLIADALGIPVYAGPVEATATGNLMMQAKALGSVHSLAEIRQIIKNSFDVKIFTPAPGREWEEPYQRFIRLL